MSLKRKPSHDDLEVESPPSTSSQVREPAAASSVPATSHASGAAQGSAPQTYTYVIMKRSSEHDPDPVAQFTEVDLDRYPFCEGLNYSRPHGRVFAIFHGQSPEAALKLFYEEVEAVEKDLEHQKGDYGMPYLLKYMRLHNIFVETDPIGKVEETGLVRAVLAVRRKEGQEGQEKPEGQENESSDEDHRGQKGDGMVFMWIERWGGADPEQGSRSGLMMGKKKRRPVGRAQCKIKQGKKRVVEEYTESGVEW